MRKTHLAVISILIGLFCSVIHADAGKSSHVKDFSGTLQCIQILLHDIHSHLNADVQFSDDEVEQLQSLLTDFRAGHLLLVERFRQQGVKAGTPGGPVAERQAAMSGRYEQTVRQLLTLLEEISSTATILPESLDRALELLERLLPEVKQPIHGLLPYRSVEPIDVEPQMTPIVVPAYRLLNAIVTGDDLSPSPEAPLSTAISAQAKAIAEQAHKLNWDPVDIYQWVKNNIATEWYWGCMKGAEETLRQRSGNDADQAALLVALLRAAGYPARYVRGVIEFFPGLASLRSLTGIDDPVRIGTFFSKAGIPCQAVMDGTEIVNYRVEHIWVETLIPYANYRGAMGDANGKLWLPLDTSIKVAGFVEQGSFDLYAAAGNPLTDLRESYLASAQSQTPLETVRSAADAFLAEYFPQVAYPDLLHARQQNFEAAGILSPSLQFTEVAITGEYTALPPELMHSIEFRVNGAESVLDISLPAHALSNRKIVIGFEPESVADHETINLWGGLDNTPAYLVRLRPVLLVDDERVVVASEGFAPGESFDLAITLTSPTAMQMITNRVLTGYPLLIGVVAQEAVLPADGGEESTATDLLHRAALDYIDRWNRGERELGELFNLRLARPLPSLVSLGGMLDVVELLGEVQEIGLQGLFIDADLRSIASVQSGGADDGREKLFMQLSALHGSILEDRLFQDNFELEAISTAKLFGLAGDGQVPVLSIDAVNAAEQLAALPFAENIKADISDAVALGWTVRIPEQSINSMDWSGIGYIKEDPLSGAAGYMLSGMTAGGSTVTRTEAWSDLMKYLFKYPLSLPPNANPDAAYAIDKISVTDLQDGVVGQAFDEPLTVYVRDNEGVPVRNASVTF
ncbi:MAG: hypothetical protein KAT93_04540, partial [Desulfuromonadales bacterium]|nr:hypothetical protein [Desulfuromonadales bacterium]